MKLYEISEVYASLAENEELEDLKSYLDMVEDDFDDKALNIARLLKNIEADISVLKEEEKRLAGKRKSMESRRDGLKAYLFDNMKVIGKSKISDGVFDIKIRKNPPSVDIYDESLIDDKYKIYTPRIMKTDIKEALKAGEEVPGARLESKESLSIR